MQVPNMHCHVSTSNPNLSVYKEIHDYCSDVEYTVLFNYYSL